MQRINQLMYLYLALSYSVETLNTKTTFLTLQDGVLLTNKISEKSYPYLSIMY